MLGKNCLIEEPKPDRAFKLFSNLVKLDLPCLCITLTYPQDLKKRYKLGDVRMIWLSKQEVKNAISPADLDILRDRITEFTKKQRGAVILLDGFEYLITTNGFGQVLKFLYDVIEKVAINRATFLMPVDPEALDKRQLALIERSMELVGEK